jgi:hypothetical protein
VLARIFIIIRAQNEITILEDAKKAAKVKVTIEKV